MAPSSSRRRQPLLFATVGPWAARFGDGFFRALPAAPGVYFFRDASGQLLYIGQSNCLKRRIGSYRQVDPDRHASRTLRLIPRTCQIDWQLCGDAAEAVVLEAALRRIFKWGAAKSETLPGFRIKGLATPDSAAAYTSLHRSRDWESSRTNGHPPPALDK